MGGELELVARFPDGESVGVRLAEARDAEGASAGNERHAATPRA
jgi:hypothetical protein